MIVMVHTARTALPATLAAVLSRATMWLSGLHIFAHMVCARHSLSYAAAVFITAATTREWSEGCMCICFFFVQVFPSVFGIIHVHFPREATSQQTIQTRCPTYQTLVSTLDMAHLTQQILLYECKPIK